MPHVPSKSRLQARRLGRANRTPRAIVPDGGAPKNCVLNLNSRRGQLNLSLYVSERYLVDFATSVARGRRFRISRWLWLTSYAVDSETDQLRNFVCFLFGRAPFNEIIARYLKKCQRRYSRTPTRWSNSRNQAISECPFLPSRTNGRRFALLFGYKRPIA